MSSAVNSASAVYIDELKRRFKVAEFHVSENIAVGRFECALIAGRARFEKATTCYTEKKFFVCNMEYACTPNRLWEFAVSAREHALANRTPVPFLGNLYVKLAGVEVLLVSFAVAVIDSADASLLATVKEKRPPMDAHFDRSSGSWLIPVVYDVSTGSLHHFEQVSAYFRKHDEEFLRSIKEFLAPN